MYKQLLVIAFFVISVPVSTWAQQDPIMGTWKMNPAKSKYDPGPLNKSATTKFEPSGANGVKSTVDQVDASGNPTHYEYTANYDGKDYPVKGSPDFDAVSLRKIDAYTVVSVWKKGSTVVRMLRFVVSKDGKTRTVGGVAVNAKGVASLNITVYDKQ